MTTDNNLNTQNRFTLIESRACQGVARRAKRSIRFTLIELLVVVAIIGILASLLMPVLSRVRYTAKLTVCTSNLKQVGMAAYLYADENESSYPYRRSIDDPGFSVPYMIRYNTLDDRPLMRSMNLEEIQCPFNDPDWDKFGETFSGYSYYFGWFVESAGDGCRLLKQGQKINFNNKVFDVLAADTLHYRSSSTRMWSSHPDYGTGRLNRSNARRAWSRIDGGGRGPLDMNYCRTDGSVYTLKRLTLTDVRLQPLPYENSAQGLTGALGRTDFQYAPTE